MPRPYRLMTAFAACLVAGAVVATTAGLGHPAGIFTGSGDARAALAQQVEPSYLDDAASALAPCSTPSLDESPPRPPAVAENSSTSTNQTSVVTTTTITGTTADPGSAPGSMYAGGQTVVRLCGAIDPQISRALELLIAGRGVNVTLTGQPDGCAVLAVTPVGTAGSGNGRQSTSLTVGAGSGPTARRYSLEIVSENGQTHVSLSSSN